MRAGRADVDAAAYDLVIVGLGAAGASLAWRLAGKPLRFAVIEPAATAPQRSQARVWCSWGRSGPGPFGHLVAASWPRVELVSRSGQIMQATLDPWRYRMLRSTDVDLAVRERLADNGVEVRTGVVEEIAPGSGNIRLTGSGVDLRAAAVVDTRPVELPRTGRSLLLQHFLGYRIRTERPAFNPSTATLMDFRVPQPPGGVAFGYLLPISAHEALVEYTEFSAGLLSDQGYADALAEFIQRRGIGAHRKLETERGVIPMTDAVFPAHPVPGVIRFGAAAGAVRPATGYAFSTLQRQADVISADLGSGAPLILPAPHRPRHLLMDSLMLQAITNGRVAGDELFFDLFRRNPVHRVLGFLDGGTGLREDLRLMATAPRAPMLKTVAGHARRRSS